MECQLDRLVQFKKNHLGNYFKNVKMITKDGKLQNWAYLNYSLPSSCNLEHNNEKTIQERSQSVISLFNRDLIQSVFAQHQSPPLSKCSNLSNQLRFGSNLPSNECSRYAWTPTMSMRLVRPIGSYDRRISDD